MERGGLRRSASFTMGPRERPARPSRPSRIPTLVSPTSTQCLTSAQSLTSPQSPLRRCGSMRVSPTEAAPRLCSPSLGRRTGSLRLPSTRSPAQDKEVWGVGSGSWGKRQQQLRGNDKGRLTPSASNRGSTTSIDKLHLNYHLHRKSVEDDDDLCSEFSYDSTMSVDRTSSRRYVVHCSSDHSTQDHSKPYLTPSQRTALLNKELKAKLKQALDDVCLRDLEISRLTQECVELRMKQARLSVSPEVSSTPPGIEKDSLNSSVHSELPLESMSVSIISEDDRRGRLFDQLETSTNSLLLEDMSISRLSPQQCAIERVKGSTVLSPTFRQEGLEESLISTIVNGVSPDSGKRASPPLAQLHFASSEDKSSHQEERTKSSVAPVRPDILNLNFNDDCERRRNPDNCLFNSLPYVIQVPVWQDEKADRTVIEPEEEKEQAKHIICPPEIKEMKEEETQTEEEDTVLQLNAAREALIETKVQLSRLRSAAENSQAEVTLKFLKSAFYHLVTDSGHGMTLATKSHWRAIQSILGFNVDECQALDAAIATGAFPGSTW